MKLLRLSQIIKFITHINRNQLRVIFLINVLAIITLNTGLSQIDNKTLLDNAYNLGLQMSESFHKGDYESFLELTHPKIIQMMGGKEKMISMFKQGMGEDFEFIGIELDKPETLIVKDSLIQCSLKQKQIIKMSGEKYYTIGYIIGISYDSGESWKFIGVASNSILDLKKHFPELSYDLDIKRQTKPILIND